MKISGWGRNIFCDSKVIYPTVKNASKHPFLQTPLVGRGLGRSYGDSALSTTVMSSKNQNHFIHFDEHTGELTCEAGVSFDDIVSTFVPKGWFLPATPGTKFVTVAGAIASDVHGKNHHLHGTFGEHVTSISLYTQNAAEVTCSPQKNSDLFHATCGGMGLTGYITQATFKLTRIVSSQILQTTYKAQNIKQALELFEANHNATYSVAWIDCLSTGANLGRSLVMTGEHESNGNLNIANNGHLAIPFELPDFTLNKINIQAFNWLYFHKELKEVNTKTVDLNPFFYPLDNIQNWNNMYGKSGFLQYQFVIPFDSGLEGLTEILKEIAKSKLGSFLAVLKVAGKQNENLLSFPMKGYTLALDFKIQNGLQELLIKLDNLVMEYQGRIYLAKDSNMSESMFKTTYPNWEKFQQVRKKYNSLHGFKSMQSERLGL